LTGEIFNLESYKRGEPVQVGNIKFIDKGKTYKYVPI